jgi:hypothetical protein
MRIAEKTAWRRNEAVPTLTGSTRPIPAATRRPPLLLSASAA